MAYVAMEEDAMRHLAGFFWAPPDTRTQGGEVGIRFIVAFEVPDTCRVCVVMAG